MSAELWQSGADYKMQIDSDTMTTSVETINSELYISFDHCN